MYSRTACSLCLASTGPIAGSTAAMCSRSSGVTSFRSPCVKSDMVVSFSRYAPPARLAAEALLLSRRQLVASLGASWRRGLLGSRDVGRSGQQPGDGLVQPPVRHLISSHRPKDGMLALPGQEA